MKAKMMKKLGATALIAINIAAVSHMSTVQNHDPAAKNQMTAELAEKMGGGAFWQGVGGGVGSIALGALGTYLGGPWGGYVGVVVGAGAGAW